MNITVLCAKQRKENILFFKNNLMNVYIIVQNVL